MLRVFAVGGYAFVYLSFFQKKWYVWWYRQFLPQNLWKKESHFEVFDWTMCFWSNRGRQNSAYLVVFIISFSSVGDIGDVSICNEILRHQQVFLPDWWAKYEALHKRKLIKYFQFESGYKSIPCIAEKKCIVDLPFYSLAYSCHIDSLPFSYNTLRTLYSYSILFHFSHWFQWDSV